MRPATARYLHRGDERHLNRGGTLMRQKTHPAASVVRGNKCRLGLRSRKSAETLTGASSAVAVTPPGRHQTAQRGASAVSLILLTASSASFVDASAVRRALCNSASILSRTTRVCSAQH